MTLPGLSQALLKAAAEQATSRQELARIEAQTASSLEQVQAAIAGRSTAATNAAIFAASGTAAAASQPAANDTTTMLAEQVERLRQEVAGLRSENAAGHAATAGHAARAARVLEDVSSASGGDAINVANAA
ncbi:hypothetical protein [Sphingomonas sp. SAFR-052]|uniref:hypothetical protein n=1 Tax=Sphingomonas sp. SAFR-052 TaxID=3436867 RepID=UPI003F7EA67A